jgi:predicted HTH domain antitoxin
MFKKFMLPILIFSIVVQLLVPVGMIAYGNKAEDDLQKYGKEFNFKVNVVFIARGDISYSLIDELATLSVNEINNLNDDEIKARLKPENKELIMKED